MYIFMARPMYNLEINCQFNRIDQSAPYKKSPTPKGVGEICLGQLTPQCKPSVRPSWGSSLRSHVPAPSSRPDGTGRKPSEP